MKKYILPVISVLTLFIVLSLCYPSLPVLAKEHATFPLAQDAYGDSGISNYFSVLVHRIQVEPFNLIATIIFFLAIFHTMITGIFQKKAHQLEERYHELIGKGLRDKNSHSILASLLHLLGEVEVVFGLWSVILAGSVIAYFNWETCVTYLDSLHYTEPLFIIVIMNVASSRPVIKFFEKFKHNLFLICQNKY